MSGRIVFVSYRPKPGKSAELDALVETHVERLRKEGLATSREPIVMRAVDGTIIEVFEWVSADAIAAAHSNAAVGEMWGEFSAVCDFVSVSDLNETGEMFPEFDAVDF